MRDKAIGNVALKNSYEEENKSHTKSPLSRVLKAYELFKNLVLFTMD